MPIRVVNRRSFTNDSAETPTPTNADAPLALVGVAALDASTKVAAAAAKAGVAAVSAIPTVISGQPDTPPPVTTPTPGSTLITVGGSGAAYVDVNTFQSGETTYGFKGHAPYLPYLDGYGGTSKFKASSASGDAVGGVYDLQRAYEGLTSNVNGNSAGKGPFLAKAAGKLHRIYLMQYVTASSHPTTGLFGDLSNSTLRADVATKFGNIAGFINFAGGTGMAMDCETGQWSPPAGVSLATYNALLEQLGLEIGTAIYTAMPSLELLIYNQQPEGSWHEYVNRPDPGGLTNADIPRTRFMVGLMNAHTNLGATGRIRWIDHFWYRALTQVTGVSLVTALKWNTQGSLASLSRYLPAATWTHMSRLFDIVPFSFANTDSSGFLTSTQEGQPTWTDAQETYRQWSMGGLRAEFTLGGTVADGLWFRLANRGLWLNHDNYTFPSGRIAAMLAAQSTSGSYSTTAPTMTATASGSGATRTIAGSASADRGIRCVQAYTYPGGTPVAAQMTFNKNGGSPTAGIPDSKMDYTLDITKGAATFAIVTAYSTQDQTFSRVVPL